MNRSLKITLPLAILLLGVLSIAGLVATKPPVEKKVREKKIPLIRVLKVSRETIGLQVTTHGTVTPRTESTLIPEVSGPIIWVSPSLVSGGFFDVGDPLLRIDPRDYEVALQKARATHARAKSELSRAQKELTRRETLLENNVGSLAQLDDAQNQATIADASLREAKASLTQAQRDLKRTELHAPFAGRVRNQQVGVGQFVTRGNPLATLYAVDYAEVRLPIPDEEIAYLELPLWHVGEIPNEQQLDVELSARFAGQLHTWNGKIVRTEGEIDARSRMVHIVARVEDPYHRLQEDQLDTRPPLAVGLFVEARILGKQVKDVFVLPRSVMRGRDRLLIVNNKKKLYYRSVDVLRSDDEHVVIQSGLTSGELVCISPLQTVVEGMEVRLLLPDGGNNASETNDTSGTHDNSVVAPS